MDKEGDTLNEVVTVKLDPLPKVEYYKLSPATFRYKRIMRLAQQRGIPWRELVGLALDFYLEFQERRSTIIAVN